MNKLFTSNIANNRFMATQIIDINKLSYNKIDQTFSAELSTIDAVATQTVTIHNPKTGNKVVFTQFKKDMDSTGEDTYGYWYESLDKKFKLLLIND